MKKNIYNIALVVLIAVVSLSTACKTEPTYYTETSPEALFDSKKKVYQRMARATTHWIWCVAGGERASRAPFLELNEMTSDEMLTPTRYNDWIDNGTFQRYYFHDFSPAHNDSFKGVWELVGQGIAHCWSAIEDIEANVDFAALNISDAEREDIVMQLKTQIAHFYYTGLDNWGGMPLYESTKGEAKARATDQETFDFIEVILKEAMTKLSKKSVLGAQETGNATQAAAAMILVRLYFNAKSYIGKEMYTETAKLCQDIIDGVYGTYELEDDWTHIFGFDNDTSPEIIWSAPSENAVSERSVDPHSSPYGMQGYWKNTTIGSTNNGFCLTPSLDVNGNSYVPNDAAGQAYVASGVTRSTKGTFRLGNPFAKFHEKDVRKQLYAYEGGKKWRGMFLMGELINPVNGGKSMGGGRQIPTEQVAVLVDQIGRTKATFDPDGSQTNASDHMKEGAVWAQEDSGIRLTKFSPIPPETENTLKGNPDIPVFRLAEAYYTLAECKMRAGDKAGAAELINTVRKRYFTEADPNPVTADNLDEWRMLDEWMVEFLGEGRRRTDLIRWDKFTTESWWDHEADGKAHYNRFPIPESIIAGNPLLEQNPGYN